MDRDITLDIQDGQVVVKRPTDQIRHKALHGLYRALLQNMVTGVSEGFTKQLELVGVGYKATNQGQLLDLSLGYSHNFVVELPKEVEVRTETVKGKNPTIYLNCIDN